MQGVQKHDLRPFTTHVRSLLAECASQLEDELPQIDEQHAHRLVETTSQVLHELIRAYARYEGQRPEPIGQRARGKGSRQPSSL